MDKDSIYYKIAIKLFDWMSSLKSPDEEWVVHPQEFLPANVCCDVVGMYRFQTGMAQIIKDVIEGCKEDEACPLCQQNAKSNMRFCAFCGRKLSPNKYVSDVHDVDEYYPSEPD
ncbi:MAG: hypothetical protein PHD05_00445 [Sphaerochaetaceae bacterium]|nr:hypothetical protein [Sphaerochaetaceae bacterium]